MPLHGFTEALGILSPRSYIGHLEKTETTGFQ